MKTSTIPIFALLVLTVGCRCSAPPTGNVRLVSTTNVIFLTNAALPAPQAPIIVTSPQIVISNVFTVTNTIPQRFSGERYAAITNINVVTLENADGASEKRKSAPWYFDSEYWGNWVENAGKVVDVIEKVRALAAKTKDSLLKNALDTLAAFAGSAAAFRNGNYNDPRFWKEYTADSKRILDALARVKAEYSMGAAPSEVATVVHYTEEVLPLVLNAERDPAFTRAVDSRDRVENDLAQVASMLSRQVADETRLTQLLAETTAKKDWTQGISVVIALISVFIAVKSVLFASKSNSAKMMLDFFTMFDSTEMRKCRSIFARKLLDFQEMPPRTATLKVDLTKDLPVLQLFEEICYLAKRKILDTKMLRNSFGWYLKRYWEAMRRDDYDVIKEARKKHNNLYEHFDDVCKDLFHEALTRGDLLEFLSDEAKLAEPQQRRS